MLEGELSAQSEVLSALNQVFIKDISVFSCICSSVFLSSLITSPAADKHPPRHDAAATMLHRWDDIMQVRSGAWFLSDMNKELRFIRPENLFFFIVRVIWVYFCKFQSWFHVFLLRISLSLDTLLSSPDWWSVTAMFVLM